MNPRTVWPVRGLDQSGKCLAGRCYEGRKVRKALTSVLRRLFRAVDILSGPLRTDQFLLRARREAPFGRFGARPKGWLQRANRWGWTRWFYKVELAAASQAFLSRTGSKVGTVNKTAAGWPPQDPRAGHPAAYQFFSVSMRPIIPCFQ
jgi:hypothetical protein